MFLARLKNAILPNRPTTVPILLGPFRGAKLHTTLRDNLRKVFGLYEHELNGWLNAVLPKVERVIDVGANDGYFTFGCAAAFRRLQRRVQIFAFEPQTECCEKLRESTRTEIGRGGEVSFTVEQTFVGRTDGDGVMTLDAAALRGSPTLEPKYALVKIDVEGAEIDVIEGASLWLNDSNFFAIEVHRQEYLEPIRARFALAGLKLEQLEMRLLLIIGGEHRPEQTWFLVSSLK